ncbi:capsular biosynthesis protein [Ideonella sp. DXS29W]|uniref:Capsular biosynthesis protein n=1 Tax=Ideonella lacteola TaxID=2984193 RepID=A0ABU9BPG2_9BURK
MKRLLKFLSRRNLALLLIGIPTLLCAIYLYVFAADRYQSESAITIKQSGDQSVGLAGLASIFAISGGTNAHADLMLLQTHILSMDMLQVVDKQLGLRKAWSAPRMDFFLRLPESASADDFLEYWRNRVEARYDDESGLLILHTQGFTAEQSQQLNRVIVQESETFINQISQRLAREQMNFAAGELATASDKYRQAKTKMLAFQEKYRMLDPAAQAQATTALSLELQSRLTKLEADLRTAKSYMDEHSYQVKAMRQQADALREQMAAEAARGTTDSKGATRLSTLAGDFRELEIEVNFAEQAYKSATIAMETARVESMRKIKSLVLVASATKPDEAAFPRRGYDLLALLLAFSLAFGIVRLLITTIEDHLD